MFNFNPSHYRCTSSLIKYTDWFQSTSKTAFLLIQLPDSPKRIPLWTQSSLLYICSFVSGALFLLHWGDGGLLEMQNFPFIFKILYPAVRRGTNLFSLSGRCPSSPQGPLLALKAPVSFIPERRLAPLRLPGSLAPRRPRMSISAGHRPPRAVGCWLGAVRSPNAACNLTGPARVEPQLMLT